jgi:transposase
MEDGQGEHSEVYVAFDAAIEDAVERQRRLEEQLAGLAPQWSTAPVVAAYQAMRGVSFLVAVTFATEIGDVRRFDTLRQLLSFSDWCLPSARPVRRCVGQA